jgi:O-antigen ligase
LSVRVAKLLPVVERSFVVLVLFLSTGALLPILFRERTTVIGSTGVGGTVGDVAQGDIVTQIIWSGIYIVTLLLILMRWKSFVRVATRDKLLLLLVGIALVSVLWSAAPELTIRRSAALVGTTLFGAYVAARYSMSELLRLLAWGISIAALFSIIFALVFPSYGIYTDPRGEAWKGIYWHKNMLGRTMAVSGTVFLLLALSGRRYRWVAWCGFGLSSTLLLLSESVTSLASLLAILALYPFYRALRGQRNLVVPLYIGALLASGVVAIWLASNTGSVLGAFGRDTTLSGRTELWDAVLVMIRQQPWLGYGYGAFWQGWEGPSAQVWLMMFHIGTGYGAADNGYLDLALDLGLLGVSVFALGFLRLFLRAIVWARLAKTAEQLWPLLFLSFMFLYTFFESTILTQNGVFWILYVALALSTTTRTAQGSEIDHTGAALSRNMRRTIVEPVS